MTMGRERNPSKVEYDPEHVFARSFGIFVQEAQAAAHVELMLDSRWAAQVKRHRWHRSQRVRATGGEVCICPGVESWVLGFGEEAEVLRPRWLRDKIAGRVESLRRRYPAV